MMACYIELELDGAQPKIDSFRHYAFKSCSRKERRPTLSADDSAFPGPAPETPVGRSMLADRSSSLALLSILALGISLRVWGITWGAPTADVPHRPHHYDEFISVITMMQINRHGGDFNPEGAHLGGTLIFFLWHGVAEVLNAVGWLDELPFYLEGLKDPDYSKLLIAGRAVIAVIDVATILMLFITATAITGRRGAGLWAALFYAILPFQVIHAHFMRPHVAANLFVTGLVLMALLILRNPDRTRYFVITGMLLGLAMASLYQLFSLAIIPGLAYLYRRLVLDAKPHDAKGWAGIFLHWRLWVMAALAFGVFFAGCPFLFLDYEAARPFIESQSNATDDAQFKGALLLDLSKTWPYLWNALPTGLFTLVIPAYLSFFYLAFRKPYRGIALPLIIFSALYVYYATKGYGLFAIRALLYLFPIFALFSGIMLHELVERVRGRPHWSAALWSVTGLCFITSLLFTGTYVYRMADRDRDPYVQVHRFFDRLPAEKPLTVGYIGWEWDRYHVPNFQDILNATRQQATVTGSLVDYLDPEHAADYLLIFNFDATMQERIDAMLETLHQGVTYHYVTTFYNPLKAGPLEFDYLQAPTDFRYPFPVIHCFAKR